MFRLQQVSTGKFYVMGESSPVPMDRQSSLFNKQDDYLGSKSYSFELPLEPNRQHIKNSHYINASNAGRTDEVIAWDSTRPLKQAKMVFTINRDKIVGELYFDGSSVSRDLKSIKLNELSQIDDQDGQLNFANSAALYAYMMTTITGDQRTKPMVFFPIKNDRAYNVIPDDQQATYPDLDFPINNYMNAWHVDVGTGIGSFMMDVSAGPYSQTRIPYFKLPYILKRLIHALGYKPDGLWLEEEDSWRIVVESNVSTLAFIIPNFTFFMPAITIGAFIKELRTKLGLLINFDDTTKLCKVESIRNIRAKGRIVDYRDKQLADTYEETGAAPNAYIITQPVDDRDKAFEGLDPDDLPSLRIGDVSGAINIEELELTSVVTRMYNGLGPQSAGWRTPEIQMPVYPTTPFDQISPLNTEDQSNFKLRFLYYHGMVENGAGYLYPYASSDNLDKDGNVLTKFSLSLDITGTTYSSMKEYFTYIKNSKPFYMEFELSLQEYFDLDASDRILVKDFDQSTVICLFDIASADLDNREIVRVKIVLYPDIQPDNTTMPLVDPDEPEIPPPPPPYDNGVVYVKLILRNYDVVEHSYPPPFYNRTSADVVVKFFADAAGTIPKDVVGLSVRVRTIGGRGPTVTSNYVSTYICTTTTQERVVEPHAAMSTNAGGTTWSWSYTMEPGADYNII